MYLFSLPEDATLFGIFYSCNGPFVLRLVLILQADLICLTFQICKLRIKMEKEVEVVAQLGVLRIKSNCKS